MHVRAHATAVGADHRVVVHLRSVERVQIQDHVPGVPRVPGRPPSEHRHEPLAGPRVVGVLDEPDIEPAFHVVAIREVRVVRARRKHREDRPRRPAPARRRSPSDPSMWIRSAVRCSRTPPGAMAERDRGRRRRPACHGQPSDGQHCGDKVRPIGRSRQRDPRSRTRDRGCHRHHEQCEVPAEQPAPIARAPASETATGHLAVGRAVAGGRSR